MYLFRLIKLQLDVKYFKWYTHKHTLLKVQGTRDVELSEQKIFLVQSGDVAARVMCFSGSGVTSNQEISSEFKNIHVMYFP